jgi:hypothetical protein
MTRGVTSDRRPAQDAYAANLKRNRRPGATLISAPKYEELTRPRMSMTAQQYLQSQAEHCRRAAAEAVDPFVAEELRRLAAEFERRAHDPRPADAARSRAA